MARRLGPLALLAIGLALGVTSVALGRAHPGWWFAGESAAASALELLAGLALIAAGAVSWHRRPASAFGLLLAAAGLAWFAPELNNPEIGSSLAFTAGIVLVAACPPLVAHAALAYPGGALRSTVERLAVGLAYLASLGLVGVLPALLDDPAAEGCAQCPPNLLLVHADESLGDDVLNLGLQLGPFWAALLIVLGGRRVAHGSAAERRLVLPVLVPAGAYLVPTAWFLQRGADRGFLGNEAIDLSLWTAQAAALCLLAGGVSWEWVRSRRTRSALAALVVDLQRSSGPGGLGAALARRLGDPSLELLHELPNGELVDASGHRRGPGAGQQLTPLVSRGRTLAVAAHRPGLFDHTSVAQEVASAAHLALDNERLQAELRAQLENLRASRARIVEASDTERRRIERDLHDGAQQRLVALSLSLGLTIAQGNGPDPKLERAQQEVKRLLDEMRELAHGIYPVALAEEGLASAVAALREESGVDIRLRMPSPENRFDPPIEHTAYVVVREMVRDEGGRGISIDVQRVGSRFVVEIVREGGIPAELVLLEDRVGAVGGELRLDEPTPGVTRVRAELPCE
jgi:signal transduction histidine kinase